jgi:4-hydroxy-2-oxoheptanedioate aldolase
MPTRFGVFCELPCAESVEIIGHAGWDFVIVDCEHGAISSAMLPGMIRAADAVKLPAIVRVSSNDPAQIQLALDAGAAGVQIPQIGSVAAARAAISSAKFYPQGMRGLNPFVRAGKFSAEPVAEFLARSNKETAVVLQLESREGFEAAPEICGLDGLGSIFIGPYDLSQSFGIPGETSDERVMKVGAEIILAANAHNVPVSVYAGTPRAARQWIAMGAQSICYSVDTVLMMSAMRDALRELR